MMRQRLSDVRPGLTRKFRIKYVDDLNTPRVLKFYVQTGLFPDGKLGEIFIRGDKMGDFNSGALDALATIMSIALQHGVPLRDMTTKLRNHRFGPAGFTGDAEFHSCTSMFDLIAQWLDRKFGG